MYNKFLTILKKRQAVCMAMAAGLLFGLSHISPNTWWLYIPALLLLFFFLEKDTSLRTSFVFGWTVGIGKALGALSWVWYIYPLDWIGTIDHTTQLLFIGLYWLLMSTSLGLGTAFFAAIYKKITFTWRLPSMPFLWLGGEILGSFIFSLYTLGAGSIPNTYFSFGYIGYLVSDLSIMTGPIIIGGVYLLSVIAFLVAYLGYLILRGHSSRIQGYSIMGCVLLFCIVSSVSLTQLQSTELLNTKIIGIETYFDSKLTTSEFGYSEREQSVFQAVEHALTQSPDIIVLPEDVRFISNFKNSDEALSFLQKTKVKDVLLIDSSRAIDVQNRTVLRGYIFDTAQDTIYEIDKSYLSPQGEFVPYVMLALLKLLDAPEWFREFSKQTNYQRGMKGSYVNIPENVPPVLFCFESVWPQAVTKLLERQDVPLVIHLTSHSWFNDPVILQFTLDRMLHVQALYNDVQILEVGNMRNNKIHGVTSNSHKVQLLEQTALWSLFEYSL